MSVPWVRVYGHGGCLPQKVLTNHDLAQRLDTSDDWIRTRTGIRQRHVAAPGEYTSDLAIQAAQSALKHAGLQPTDVEGIIVATTTPDWTFPATAVQVQAALGTPGFAFDMQAACAGFVSALITAYHMIRGGQAQRMVVIGAETMSRLVDWNDRSTAVLFGDGAGAVIVSAETSQPEGPLQGFIDGLFETDGSCVEHLYVNGGPSRTQTTGVIHMQGREVFRYAVDKMSKVSERLLHRWKLSIHDIDWIIPHQANLRIIEGIAQRLECPLEKCVVSLDQHANTSAASIPLALDHAAQAGSLKPGHLVLCPALGAGFAWGAALFRWG